MDETISGKSDKSFPWRALLLWPFGIVLIYFLSYGPIDRIRMESDSSGRSNHVIDTVYTPWSWSYDHPPLHKPLGLYMHLWVPNKYDEHGELRWHL
jgi:hypothetical protein